jgi:hypothetical protein
MDHHPSRLLGRSGPEFLMLIGVLVAQLDFVVRSRADGDAEQFVAGVLGIITAVAVVVLLARRGRAP